MTGEITEPPLPGNAGDLFQTGAGIRFRVLAGKHFVAREIAVQHRKYLAGLREGLLVSVFFYGKPVPVITVGDGVVRLTEIECDGKVLKEPLAMSRALGVTRTRQPLNLSAG